MSNTKERPQSIVSEATRVTTKKNGTSATQSIRSEKKWSNITVGHSNYNPLWKSQVKRVIQAGTSFSGDFREFSADPFYASSESTRDPLPLTGTKSITHGGVEVSTSSNGGNFIWSGDYPPSVTEADNKAKAQMLKEIRKTQTSFQGGVFLGELGQLVRMIRHPAEGLRRGVNSYLTRLKKVKRIKNRNSRRSALADTWLEYSFGWTPFINDIEDAKETIANSSSRLKTKKVRAYGEAVVSYPPVNLGNAGISTPTYKLSMRKKATSRVTYYGVVGTGRGEPGSSVRRVGLDLSNFAPTAWELIPYSFLIDYFVNVGEVINAISVDQSDVKWLMRREELIQEFDTHWSGVGPSGEWKSRVTSPGTFKGKRVQFSRSPFYAPLTISLRFKVPGSNLQWLNIAALARNHRSLLPFF